MEELQEGQNIEIVEINEDNLYKKIWFHPKATLSFILKNCPEKYVIPLLVLGGIGNAIDRAFMKDMGDEMGTYAVLGFAVITGALFGWISYYIYAWGMSVTGKWLNGNAAPSQFRTIIAFSLIPSICALLLVVPEVFIFGDDLFRSEPVNASVFHDIMWLVFGMIEFTLGIWTIVILANGISLIQGFGTGKAILNMFLPALLIIVPIIAIAFFVSILSSS